MKVSRYIIVLLCVISFGVKAESQQQSQPILVKPVSATGDASSNLTGFFSKPQIVGGNDASRDEFPEFVQIFIDAQNGFILPWCGGTLISGIKVLTAAHCTIGYEAERFYVLPEFYSFNDVFDFTDLIPITAKVEHPRYSQHAAFDNDVALLTLSRNSNTPKATLFALNHNLSESMATIIGTGLLVEGGSQAQTLQKINVPIVGNDVCEESYGGNAITENMICAGIQSGGKDACDGDSGGPMMIEHDQTRLQAGIASWGSGCARPDFYGVYTRINEVVNFISTYVPRARILRDTSSSINPVIDMLLDNDDDASDDGPAEGSEERAVAPPLDDTASEE